MAQIELSLPSSPLARQRGRFHLPGWLLLLLRNPKSRLGLVMIAFVVVVALIAPLISVADPNGFAAQFASAVGGLVFVEYIFSYPGVGYTLQQAIMGNDYALAQCILVVLSVCVIVANLVMDVLNLVLDPRLRTG